MEPNKIENFIFPATLKPPVSYAWQLHSLMLSQKLMLIYEGEFNQEITRTVLLMAEKNLEYFQEDLNLKKKVFNVMVECLQNIAKHSDLDTLERTEKHNRGCLFMIGRQGEKYLIVSGNPIEKSKVEQVKKRIEQINQLDKDGLKALYRDIIKEGIVTHKGGAGLGLVDMARKSGNPLQYAFNPINNELDFFTLQTTISIEEDS